MNSVIPLKRAIAHIVFLVTIGWSTAAFAQVGVGTWARTDDKGKGMTMTVEACCNGGRRLVYHVPAMGGQPPATLTVDSPMDGTAAPVVLNGKPSGETMAIKRADDRHYHTVLKMKGQPFGTSDATLSADGKTLTVESVTNSGGKPETITETWVKR